MRRRQRQEALVLRHEGQGGHGGGLARARAVAGCPDQLDAAAVTEPDCSYGVWGTVGSWRDYEWISEWMSEWMSVEAPV